MDWRDITVAGDGTHHLRSGCPIYAERYDDVLAFHEPGLAPVRRDGLAWHVDATGRPAYERRFVRTFGFYEGRAAVAGDGWHHVLPDGVDAYPERYAWCGNYQCCRVAVRSASYEYSHLDLGGRPAYAARWRYAGDYRDGIAVVQQGDGRSTHIDVDGKLVHGTWYVDLDVFHKGLARARDADGWMHVDRQGRPAYARRFRAVEPFYNGQGRVERFDGALEVIDEAGHTLVELRPPLRDEFMELSSDLVGYWRTQTLRTAVTLGVFDALPGTIDELAQRTATDGTRLARLLRGLGELGVVERNGARWRTTQRGTFLRTDDGRTLADATLEYGGQLGTRWSALPDAMRSSSWKPSEVWDELTRTKGRIGPFHRMLRSYARHDYRAVADALDLEGINRVIDAGGGVGVLSDLILFRFAGVHVTLVDRPEVTVLVDVAQEVRARLDVRAANIFESWGVTGQAVVLARVLHDWDDADAVRILRRSREALPSGGRVFIVEMVLEEHGFSGGLCDLHLLVTTGGRERAAAEFKTLLERGGFVMLEVRRLSALPSIIVGIAQ